MSYHRDFNSKLRAPQQLATPVLFTTSPILECSHSCRMHIEHQLNSNKSACRNIHRHKTTLRHTTHRDALSRSQQDITSPNKYFFKNTRSFLGLFILSHNKPYSAEPAKTHQSQLCIKKKENLSRIHQAFFRPDETRSRPCRSL